MRMAAAVHTVPRHASCRHDLPTRSLVGRLVLVPGQPTGRDAVRRYRLARLRLEGRDVPSRRGSSISSAVRLTRPRRPRTWTSRRPGGRRTRHPRGFITRGWRAHVEDGLALDSISRCTTPLQAPRSSAWHLGKRVLAWVVIAAVVVLALKSSGVVIGLVMAIFRLVVVAVDRRRDLGLAPPLTRWPTWSSPSSSAWPAGIIGKIKGSSFCIWFLISGSCPFLGLLAALLYRRDGRAAPPVPRAAGGWSSCTTRSAPAAAPSSTSPRSRSSRTRPRRAVRLVVPVRSPRAREGGKRRDACSRRAHGVPQSGGCRRRIRVPGGANLPTYDALVRRRHPPHPRAPRGRRRPRRGGLRQGLRQGRRRASGRRARGDQHRHAAQRRDDGLRPGRRSSPARCARTCSAPTASRRRTRSASRCRSSSTPS